MQFDDTDLKMFTSSELGEWATAHTAVAKLLEKTDRVCADKHARSALQACAAGSISFEVHVETSARITLGSLLLAGDDEKAAEATMILKVALALDPTNQQLKDLVAIASQKQAD